MGLEGLLNHDDELQSVSFFFLIVRWSVSQYTYMYQNYAQSGELQFLDGYSQQRSV